MLAWTSERVAAWVGVEVTVALREPARRALAGRPRRARPAPDRAVTLAAQGAASVEPYAARFLPALVAGAVVPVMALATLFWVDWVSGLIVLLTLPLLPFFAALIGRADPGPDREAVVGAGRRCPATSSTSCAACPPSSATAAPSGRSR